MSVIHGKGLAYRLNLKRAGLDFLNKRTDKAKIFGLQDPKLRNTVAVPCNKPATEPRKEVFWNPPTAGLAARKPPVKQEKTARGWTLFKDVVIWHESETELRVALRIQARRDVVLMYSQFPVFAYRGEDGKMHQHTADLYVEYEDGLKQAIVIKHEKKREMMLDEIERIKADPSFAQVDDIRLVTETYGTIEAAENAKNIIWSRRYHDQSQVDALLAFLAKSSGPVQFRFGELLRHCESRRLRRIAIWRLIDLGLLISPTGEKISEITWLTKVSAH
jgi:hypothetical protein